MFWLRLRFVFGFSWIQAALPKLPDPGWMQTGEALKGYLEKYVTMQNPPRPRITLDAVAFDWYNAFLRGLLDTEAYVWLARLIAIGELLIGIAMIVGLLVGVTAGFSLFTGVNLGLAGSARTNFLFLIASITLLYAWQTAAYYGLDRFILPYLRRMWRPHKHLVPLLTSPTAGET